MENLIKDLEELTQRMPWGTVERGETGFYVNGLDVPCYMPYGIESIVRAISELKKYEELKKKILNGRLVELPCKVGDEVFYIKEWILEKTVEKMYVDGFNFSEGNKEVVVIGRYGEIAYDVFPTKEAAEEKLKELRGE